MNAVLIEARKYGQITEIYIDGKLVTKMASIPTACIKQIKAILDVMATKDVDIENVKYVPE